jgi:hypothetical protein
MVNELINHEKVALMRDRQPSSAGSVQVRFRLQFFRQESPLAGQMARHTEETR